MALGWLWVACRPSSFKVQCSTFDVGRSRFALFLLAFPRQAGNELRTSNAEHRTSNRLACGATALPIKWIAARVQIGTAKGAKTVLHHLAHRQIGRAHV